MFGNKRRDAEIERLKAEVKHLRGFATVRMGVVSSVSGYVFGALEMSLNGFRSQEVISVDNGEYGQMFVEPPAPNVTLSRRLAERLIVESKFLFEKAGSPTSPDEQIFQHLIDADRVKAKDHALAAADL